MMRRVIKGFTRILGEPPGWKEQTDKRCSDLHVRDTSHDGMLVCLSAWEPSPQELELLNAGGSIILHIWGGQPPVALTVDPMKEG